MSSLIHAVARVRSMEDQLLTSSHVDRIIASDSFEDAYAVLGDLGYADESSYFRDTHNFEEVLETGLHASSKILDGFGIKDVKKILTVLWDIQNIKLVIKAEKCNQDLDDVAKELIPYGSYTPLEVVSAVKNGDAIIPLQSIIQECLSSSEQKKWEQQLETALFSQVRGISGNHSFLKSYIDRIEKMEELKRKILEMANEDLLLEYVQFRDILAVAFEKPSLAERVSFLEIALDEAMVQFLKSSSLSKINGWEPIFSFFWRKERNARIIRSLLLAKKSGMSGDEMRSEFPQFIF